MKSNFEGTLSVPLRQCYVGAYLPLILFWILSISACSDSAKSTSGGKSKTAGRSVGIPAQKNRVSPSKADSGVALILVDVQQDFFDSQTEMANPDFVSNLKRTLETCRNRGIEVIHVRTAFSDDPNDQPQGFRKFFGSEIPCVIGTPGVKALQCARQAGGEKVFYKKSFDPFEIDDMNEYLKNRKIGQVLVCGLTTDVCVLSTCFSATNKGYLTTLIEDCAATRNPMAHQFVISRYRGMLFDTMKSTEIESKFLMTSVKSTRPIRRNVPASSYPAQR